MSVEKVGNAFYDTRSVDYLTLEILHDIQEVIVHVRVVLKSDLYRIEVA
jgi:hypothetical protein